MSPELFNLLLQQCIAPVILISGVGLLLASINVRLGRTIDRLRHLANDIDNDRDKNGKKRSELKILYRRGHILRISIVSLCFSIFCSSTVIFQLVMGSVLGTFLKEIGIAALFGSVAGIMISSIALFVDVTLSLHAIKVEVKEYL